MCCSGGGDAPSSPDPYATANAQKNAYIESATANAYLNRMDEQTPFGSVHYEEMPWDTGTATGKPLDDNWAAALGRFPGLSGLAESQGFDVGSGSSLRNRVPRMRKVTSLNPDEQAILDQSRANKIQLGGLAQSKIGEVGDAFGTPFDFSGAPGAGFGVLKKLQALAGQAGPDLSAYEAMAKRGGPKLDEAARQQVQDAMYRRETAQLDPRYKQQQIDLETQLANQGIGRGSEAWSKATTDFNRSKDSAYGDALDRSILAGGAEQSRLFGLKSSRRAQNLGALGSLYNMQQGKRKDQMAAYANLFGMRQKGRQSWLQEQMTRRQMPMDELNMLLGKAEGFNIPQFKSPSDINIQAPDIASLLQNDFSNKQGINKQNQDDTTAMISSLAMAAAMAFSSSRTFKTDAAPTPTVLPGIEELSIESWRYKPEFNDPNRHIGPYAEDFKELFGVGDGKMIHVVDALGVCLKAIQELSARVNHLQDTADAR
jgi:hypothetical protein